MGLPDGFQYDKTSGTLVPVVITEQIPQATLPDVVISTSDKETSSDEEKTDETSEETEKEVLDAPKTDERVGVT